MLNNKIKCILALFIILSLSMNAFSATNFTDDSNDVALQSSNSVDEVAADAADDVTDDTDGDTNDQGDDTQNNEGTDTNTEDTSTTGGNDKTPTTTGTGIGGRNGTGMNFSGMNFSGMNGTGMNFSNMSLDDFLDMFMKLMGGNETNTTNDTVDPEVSDVPAVATSTSYKPVSQPVEKQAQHTITRVRDNKIISQGDTLKLEGVNKLFDSDFTNGHLLVYIDGKLIFNELTTDDLATPIFGITDSYLGQHQITVEFTANGDSNTNKYTEDVIIS